MFRASIVRANDHNHSHHRNHKGGRAFPFFNRIMIMTTTLCCARGPYNHNHRPGNSDFN